MTLEGFVKMSPVDPVLNAASGVVSGMMTIRTYASVIAPQMAKTVVRLGIDRADKM